MTPSTTSRGAIALALVSLLAVGCGEGGTAADSGGEYLATLTAPAGALDGAAVIELAGAGVSAISAVDGELFTASEGEVIRVVVVRDAPGTISFRFNLESGRSVPRAAVVEVSDANDDLRESVAGYGVRFSR